MRFCSWSGSDLPYMASPGLHWERAKRNSAQAARTFQAVEPHVTIRSDRTVREATMFRIVFAATVSLVFGAQAQAIELDPKIVGFKLPDQIQWTENARAGNRSVVLQGDPSKPGPYAMLLTWLPGHMSRPHFHPNDRFFMVLAGTWWVGNGGKFDPEATVPMPAGTHVIHWAKGVHYDGAKTEPATILVWGEGPATSTPFVAAQGREKK